MTIDPKNYLILIKDEDKTSSVESWEFDDYKPVVLITYNNGKTYPYNANGVRILSEPNNILIKDKIVYCNSKLKKNVVMVQKFDDYARIVYENNCSEVCHSSNLRIISSILDKQNENNCFEYLKEVSEAIGLKVGDYNILSEQYNRVDFVREDSVLACYLSGKINNDSKFSSGYAIYPFEFNISQKQAVDNALMQKLSVIEGPPGTGKTQSILNIIANAVVRGESVAVVSKSNSAIDNVYQKLKKLGVEFIAARLGSAGNKEEFIKNQSESIPDLSKWKEVKYEDRVLLKSLISELVEKLKIKNELAALSEEEYAIKKEKEHYDDYYRLLRTNSSVAIFSRKVTADKILSFANECENLAEKQKRLGVFRRLYFRLSYGVKHIKAKGSYESVISYCRELFYQKKLEEIADRKNIIERELKDFDFNEKMKESARLSMDVFKHSLFKRYGQTPRKKYELEQLKNDSESFLFDYPIVLSTTYSICSCLSKETFYDYLIIDESSQADIVSGALALSCAKKAVIVGDLKQLPNVVKEEERKITNSIYSKYNLHKAYKFYNHSLLSSITELFPSVKKVLLKEHYRCVPEIIGFCNQRFYNGELIIMTEHRNDVQAMTVYRTAAGNMARDHINERQIDVIQNEVIPEQELNVTDGSVGIVTPYRAQANRLQEVFAETAIKADTADNFQGQERDTMVFSTVDNEIGDFASNPNRLNVAVSRARDRFIVVTDGNDNDKKSPIHDLIEYIKYHNHDIIDSKISSVFDYLYKQNAKAREEILKKYGRISEFDSENLAYLLIKKVLSSEKFTHLDVVSRVPLRLVLKNLSLLEGRELSFATNRMAHIDFLVFSKVTHCPLLAIEVDGFTYHNNKTQKERDLIKDEILRRYDLPILRLSTAGSGEKEKITDMLIKVVKK